MHVVKVTTLKVRLDATEQFTVNKNYSDKPMHVTELEATLVEGNLKEIKAFGLGILGKTGKPGKVRMRTHWFKFDTESNFVAPVKVLNAIARASQGVEL